MLKIGVAGTHSTGKSTFITKLREIFEQQGLVVSTLSDFATHAKDKGFPILTQHTFASTLWIVTKNISLELEAELHADVILIDRPVIDALGYLNAALKYTNREITLDESIYLKSIIQLHSKRYDLLFATVLDKSIEQNLDKDLVFREIVDEQIHNIFRILDIPYYGLTSNNFDTSIAVALEKATI